MPEWKGGALSTAQLDSERESARDTCHTRTTHTHAHINTCRKLRERQGLDQPQREEGRREMGGKQERQTSMSLSRPLSVSVCMSVCLPGFRSLTQSHPPEKGRQRKRGRDDSVGIPRWLCPVPTSWPLHGCSSAWAASRLFSCYFYSPSGLPQLHLLRGVWDPVSTPLGP